MKRELLALEVIETPSPDAPESLLGRQVEDQRQIGREAAGGVDVQLANEVEIDTPAVSLVGDGRVGVAVAEHDPTAREPAIDLLRHVLMPRGHEQEDLAEGPGSDARALEQATHGHAERGAVGL